ncbi:MAG: HNH endonuclease [Phycisphaerales bacterium]|nr:HNH endonuclease [Phycisphaerales bacterium]
MKQKKPGVLKNLKQTFNSLVDLKSDPGINAGASTIESFIRQQQHSFDWNAACKQLGARKAEHTVLAHIVYERAVDRVWKDGVLASNERDYLSWLESRIPIPAEDCRLIREEKLTSLFTFVLRKTLEDGQVSLKERNLLAGISSAMNQDLGALVKKHLQTNGADVFEHPLDKLIQQSSNRIVDLEQSWREIENTAISLGIDSASLRSIAEPYGEKLLEHIIIDAKADDKLSMHEEDCINWVLDTFSLSSTMRGYATTAIDELTTISQIVDGILPSIPREDITEDEDIEFNPSEVVHAHFECTMHHHRKLKSGPRTNEYNGSAFVTDRRLIFYSWEDDIQKVISLRSVLRFSKHQNGFTFGENHGSRRFYIHEQIEILKQVVQMAIHLAKGRVPQAIQDDLVTRPTRHISNDVRQRIWTDYGGKCADCSSTHYLEFDHIIPFSKGGSSELQNIQLLCRGCNLKKSNNI